MATAAIQTPSHNRVESGSSQLPLASYPNVDLPPSSSWEEIAAKWVHTLNSVLQESRTDGIDQLFLKEASWRDQLGLSWDFRTLNGPDKIKSFLRAAEKGSRIRSIAIDRDKHELEPQLSAIDYHGNIKGVLAFLKVETVCA